MFLLTIFVIKFFLDLFSFYLKTLKDKKGGKFLYSLRDNITFFIFFQFFILTSYAQTKGAYCSLKSKILTSPILLNFNKQILRLILSFTV